MLNYSNKINIKYAFIIVAWARAGGKYMEKAYNKQLTTLSGAIKEAQRLLKTIPQNKQKDVYFTIRYLNKYIKYIEA